MPRGEFFYTSRGQVVKSGISFGTAMAIVLSYSVNKSILWGIVHGLLSWIYVIYFAITR